MESSAQPTPQRLTAQDCRTLALASFGGALEFYDFVIFAFFAVIIGERFFPSELPEWLRQLQTFGLFAAGYLARPLGGIILAHFGDMLGRKKMFNLSILLMSIPTALMGILPDYTSIGSAAPLILLLLRLLQGAAIGGEVPGAWVFVAEHVPKQRIGVACGLLTAGLTVGIMLGSLMTQALMQYFSPEQLSHYGWRIAFLVGGIFGLVGLVLRRWLHETPVFKTMQHEQRLSTQLPIKTLLTTARSPLFRCVLMTWILSAGIVVLILMAPALMQQWFAIPSALSLQANFVATVSLLVGCVIGGMCADFFGAVRSFTIGLLLLVITTLGLFYTLTYTPHHLYIAYSATGLALGVLGIIPGVMVRSFPAAIRFSGLSTAYNLGYAIFGGLTPLIVSLVMPISRFFPLFYLLLLCVLGFVISIGLRRNGKLM